MTENSILLLDSNRGVYIPHQFGNMMRGYTRSNINEVFEEMLILEEGNPHDTEHYWEAWDKVLNEFWFERPSGERFELYQSDHGDLWAVPIDELKQLNEEEDVDS